MVKYSYEKVDVPYELLMLPLPEKVVEILYRRGFTTADSIRKFLFSKASDVYKNTELLDMDKAVAILSKATEVVVYRDYDCDGICSGALLQECLSYLGITTHDYANKREEDGYGMCVNGVKTIMKRFPNCKLILTCDNGIAAHEAVDFAKKNGFTVIITDHHEQQGKLPKADAVIDPKRIDETVSFRELCGAGVAFKLMAALFTKLRKDREVVLNTLDIVALATIADVVPIIDENRTLVKEGLDLIANEGRPFFKAMISTFEIKDVKQTGTVAFKLAPAVNSLSRMGEDTSLAVKGLLTNDMSIATVVAKKLYDTNEERKALTDEESENALACAKVSTNVISVGDFSEGIIGILAGKLKEEYSLPAIVISNTGKASARGIDGFNLKEALDKIPKGVLLAYGGHAKAAGFTVADGKINEFIKAFTKLTDEAFKNGIPDVREVIDIVVSEDELTYDLIKDLSYLEPYGEAFPAPLFGLTAETKEYFTMGQEKNHIKYVTDNGLQIIRWNGAEEQEKRSSLPKKFIGYPEINYWNGKNNIQFICEN